MQITQSTQNAAYAFMVLFAGSVISNYGRDAAVAATNGAETQMSAAPGYGSPAGSVSGPIQYGLVQTGVVAVASIDGTGRQSVMPVFQIIQLQSAAALTVGNMAAPNAPNVAAGTVQQPAELKIPQGMNIAPPSGMSVSGTLCEIKGVRVLTETPDACGVAGGQVPAF